MTIYLIKWINKDDSMPYQYACSSFTAAQKKMKELLKDQSITLVHNIDGPILTLKPKSQADVIDLINSL